jgi:hypothetical protein
MSIIRDGFRSLYRSGAYFSEGLLPKALERAGMSHARAAKIGAGAGTTLGIASLIVGIGYALAIPLALPMCGVAITIYAGKGIAMAAGLMTILAGTATVVTTTALGMCRELTNHTSNTLKKANARLHAAPAPAEKRGFGQKLGARLGFRKAAEQKTPAAPPAPAKTPVPVPQPG